MKFLTIIIFLCLGIVACAQHKMQRITTNEVEDFHPSYNLKDDKIVFDSKQNGENNAVIIMDVGTKK